MQILSRLRPLIVSTFFLAAALACSKESPPSVAHAAESKAQAAPRSDVQPTATPDVQAPEKLELMVYAATSTRDALQAMEAAYERDHKLDLIFNFGSSGDLSKQIIAAAKADVFISADEKEMDKLEQAKLVAPGTRRALLSNQLVVIEPAGPSGFTTPFQPSQLADPRIKHLSLGNVETVPAGRYAKAWLEQVGAWSGVSDRILPGVDVRAALAAVESGGAQAGIVYRTDAARSTKARVVFAVPVDEGPKISYPVAAVAGRPNPAQASAFIDYLGGPDARKIFEDNGFTVLAPAVAKAK